MQGVFQKITAFFMSIVAFFAGLFGLNKQPAQPQPEPTTITEPAAEPTTVVEEPTEPGTEPATEPASEPEETSTEPESPAYRPLIVTTTDVFEAGYDAITAIDRLARLGYKGIDMGFDYWTFSGSPFGAADYLDWAQELRTHADAVGIPYTHAHAPADAGNSYWLERSIRASAVIGAKYCVVHPAYQQSGVTITDNETFISVNAGYIRSFLPLAEECGVVLLSENLLWGASADPRIISALVEEVDSPWLGWCFDTGHAYAKGYQPQILTDCSVVPLSVHIQDSLGSDDHLIPGDGIIDWDAFVQTLKAVGYTGDCVVEAHHQSLNAPDGERDAILLRLLEKSRELRAAMMAE